MSFKAKAVEDLAEDMLKAIDRHKVGMTLAEVIGTLEIVKLELFTQEKDDE